MVAEAEFWKGDGLCFSFVMQDLARNISFVFYSGLLDSSEFNTKMRLGMIPVI